MALLLHIIIALTSVGFSTYVLISPTGRRLAASYGLVAATVASGFYLVFSTSVSILHTCVSGLCYTGIVTVMIMAAQQKLAAQPARRKIDR